MNAVRIQEAETIKWNNNIYFKKKKHIYLNKIKLKSRANTASKLRDFQLNNQNMYSAGSGCIGYIFLQQNRLKVG